MTDKKSDLNPLAQALADKALRESELAKLAAPLTTEQIKQILKEVGLDKYPPPPPPEPQPVSPEQAAGAPGYGLNGIYANRFHLWANDHTMRFLIGDSITGPDLQFKLSFVMTRADARDLIRLATELLDETEPTKK